MEILPLLEVAVIFPFPLSGSQHKENNKVQLVIACNSNQIMLIYIISI